MTPRQETSFAHGATSSHRHNNEHISALFTPRQQQDYNGSATPRGNVGSSAQDLPPSTPRNTVVDLAKGTYTPRHTNGGSEIELYGYNDSKPIVTPRQSKNISFRTASNDFTHSQNKKDPNSSPGREELALNLTPRQKDHNGITLRNEYSSGLIEMSLTPRNDNSSTSPLKTPRRGDSSGMTVTHGVVVTPRSYNITNSGQWTARGTTGSGFSSFNTNKGHLKQSMVTEQQTLFDPSSPRGAYPIQEYIKSEGWSGTSTNGININGDMISPRKYDPSSHGLIDSQRSPRHVSKAVLSVEKNPSGVTATTVSHRHSKGRVGHSDVEMTTPRRQRVVAAAVAASEKTAAAAASSVMTPRGLGDLHRVPVHGNLSHRSERMQPMAVMKLPPLDAAIHKPVVS
ncbi:hypothetical protein EGW08_000977 [Elysia chlorotica]|uniref:Uncharacterized protein n=1 Tax=Elysia chlorotica TaxID=188477 RepID=A0A433UBQ3_ELYCH|nr:hypothetical protein EGW08_000977 [Elysia chlorotica]